jgi:D-serine deaminase-like pyridoxal phosphate-dependent protein
MMARAGASQVMFRPHFKTHQSADVGQWFKEAGITCITVSSVSMAIYFAHSGWKNILIAFPFNILEINSIHELPIMTEIFLTVESVETVQHLAQNLGRKVNIYIKIDAGHHRTGLSIESKAGIENILNEIKNSKKLHFTGFLAHYGNTYNARSREEIKTIYKNSTKLMLNLKQRYQEQYPDLIISIGDTPSCSIVENFEEIDEIRPGNFIFYDLMQYQLGTCELSDIAIILACPVVALHPDRNEVIFYGGGVHVSKEFIHEKNGDKSYGKVVELNKNGWGNPMPETFVSALSQEHGIIKTTPVLLKKIRIGDTIGILPVHSCMTANLANFYLTLNNRVLKKMRS